MKYIINILILVLLVGCKKDNIYTGDIPEEEPFDPIEILPLPVTLNLGDNAEGVGYVTKGYGGFNQFTSDARIDTVVWRNSVFYVYSFLRSENADYTEKWSDNQNDSMGACLIDGTRDVNSQSLGGKPVKLNNSDWSTLNWVDSTSIYYNLSDYKISYDFFLYYLDDFEVDESNIHRNSDYISIDVSLDGMRDFMGAKAGLTERQLALIEKSAYKESLRESCFSTFSANYMINPTFVLSHYLTRIRFEIYPGGNLNEGKDSECFDVTINSISVSSKADGKMTVASKNSETHPLGIDFSNSSYSDFKLRNKYLDGENNIVDSVSHARPVYVEGDELIANSYDRHGIKVDGCFLLAPQESYDMSVNLSGFEDKTGEVPVGNTDIVVINIKPQDGSLMFEPGKAYVVRLAVFGGVRIEADIDVEPWGDGGEIIIDPDK